MPQRLTLEVGTDVVTHTFSGSAAQVRQSIVRICKSLGISTDGTPLEVGQRLLAHIVDDMRRRAEASSVTELTAAQTATIAAQAKTDNPL